MMMMEMMAMKPHDGVEVHDDDDDDDDDVAEGSGGETEPRE